MRRLWLVPVVGAVFAAWSGVTAAADPVGYRLVDRLEVILEKRTYISEIFDSRERSLDRKLVIRCVSGCAKQFAYREDFADAPLAAFRLWDGSDQLITLWTGGTAYWVRIYILGDSGIRKVFDSASKSAPDFAHTPMGDDVVILHHREGEGDTPVTDQVTRGEVWTWNGQVYAPTDKGTK
jgi:hypothetical protein